MYTNLKFIYMCMSIHMRVYKLLLTFFYGLLRKRKLGHDRGKQTFPLTSLKVEHYKTARQGLFQRRPTVNREHVGSLCNLKTRLFVTFSSDFVILVLEIFLINYSSDNFVFLEKGTS